MIILDSVTLLLTHHTELVIFTINFLIEVESEEHVRFVLHICADRGNLIMGSLSTIVVYTRASKEFEIFHERHKELISAQSI